MQVNISGHHMDYGDNLESYTKDKLDLNVKKFFGDVVSAHVTFSKVEHKFFKTIITINEGTAKHHEVVAEAVAIDVYKSFDDALARAISQLKKDKEKLNSHHQKEVRKQKEAI